VPEQGVVVEPDHADIDERDDEGEVSRPLVAQRGGQVAPLEVRAGQLQDQQRDDDGEDAVAERFGPPGSRQSSASAPPASPESVVSAAGRACAQGNRLGCRSVSTGLLGVLDAQQFSD